MRTNKSTKTRKFNVGDVVFDTEFGAIGWIVDIGNEIGEEVLEPADVWLKTLKDISTGRIYAVRFHDDDEVIYERPTRFVEPCNRICNKCNFRFRCWTTNRRGINQ